MPYQNRIYIDANPYQVRVAVTEDGDLAELFVERKGSERMAGNIYKGRVKNVLPGMQAAFVDIGLQRNAFLYAGDINIHVDDAIDEAKTTPDIKSLVSVGQDILVQVLKEPFGTKGARITTNITLPSRSVVLMPNANYVGISRRIEGEATRERLKEIFEEIKPEGMGIIARTVSLNVKPEELAEEIEQQLAIYDEIRSLAMEAKTPSLIYSEENLTNRVVRDLFNEDTLSLEISDRGVYDSIVENVQGSSPQLLDKICYFDQHYDMFEYYNLESRIDKALRRKVWLKSGGYLIFDYAEALTVIDVNTGKYVGKSNLQQTILETNMEAAREVARQIRLRDISGIIVVDFIDMDDAANRTRVMEALKDAVQRDRTRTTIMGLTDLGIVEMTRKKVKQSIDSLFYAPCPYCAGDGVTLSTAALAMQIRKDVLRMYHESDYEHIIVKAHPAVIAELKAMTRKEARLIPDYPGKQVFMLPNDNMHIEHFECYGAPSIAEVKKEGAVLLA